MDQNNKNVWWLGIVSFINDTASDMILAVLPLFIKDIGGAGIAVGIISGFGESIASLFKMFAGFWSDKLGKRKPFVFFGYGLSSFCKFLFTYVTIWPQLLVLRSFERLGKGMRSAPRDAILAASTDKKTRGKWFGIHRAFDSGGSVLGAIVALVLFWYFKFDFKSIFFLAGVISFVSLIPLFFVQEKRMERVTATLKFGLKSLPLPLKFFIAIATLFALGNFSYMFFVLKSQPYFTGRFGIAMPIILYIIYNISFTFFAVPSGMLSDKIGRKTVLFIGYGLFGLVCLGFIFAKSLISLVILFLLFGLNYALVESNERAFVSDLAPEAIRGTALGTFHMLISFVALPGGFIAGYLWDISTTYTFIYGAIISLLVISSFSVFSIKNLKLKS
ncbi:MAG: MFS transporter [Candidatus Ratteibacteria bacterium]|nr:MFS transporter [Candidatus Ratteibacteria bacterium]